MPIYMKIDTIDGDVINEQFPNWHEVFSYSWGETSPRSIGGGGGGGGAGRVQMEDFHVQKPSGKGSPAIFLACASGRHLPAVQLVFTRISGEREQVFQRFNLADCAITAFHVDADAGGFPTESLSINFTRIEFIERFQDPTGVFDSQSANWDLRTGRGG